MIRFALIGAGVLAVTAVVTNAQAPTKTTYDKVYSAAQAERGKKTFGEKCSGCHEPSRFSGDTFHEAWDDKALKEIWDIASGTMPEDNPGSLKQQEYADIIAYFLSLNDYPAGDAELQPGAAPMAAIKVAKKQ
ncbi:MAG: cytochrome c [Cyanobacteria bacterium]|nr:cytochrome c [Cyanobacteriota bacterium]